MLYNISIRYVVNNVLIVYIIDILNVIFDIVL